MTFLSTQFLSHKRSSYTGYTNRYKLNGFLKLYKLSEVSSYAGSDGS